MSHFVYFAYCDEMKLVKIGLSKTPRSRVKQLKPRAILFAMVPESSLMECDAHRLFQEKRAMGEWFTVTRTEVLETLREKGLPVLVGPTLDAAPEKKRPQQSVAITEDIAAMLDEACRKVGMNRRMVAQAVLRNGLSEVMAGRLTVRPIRFELVEKPTQPQPAKTA